MWVFAAMLVVWLYPVKYLNIYLMDWHNILSTTFMVPQRLKPTNFGNPPTLHLWFGVKCHNNCWMDCSTDMHGHQSLLCALSNLLSFLSRALVERWRQTAVQRGTCQTEVNCKHRWVQICPIYKHIPSTNGWNSQPIQLIKKNESNWVHLTRSKCVILHNIKSVCFDLFFSSLKASYLSNSTSVLILIAPTFSSQWQSLIYWGKYCAFLLLGPWKVRKGKLRDADVQQGVKKEMMYFASKERTEMLKSQADEKKIMRCGKGWVEVRDMEGEKMMWEMSMWRGGGKWWGSPMSAFSILRLPRTWLPQLFTTRSAAMGKNTHSGLYFIDWYMKQLLCNAIIQQLFSWL